MKPCWKDLGLTEDGAKVADEALPHLVAAVKILGDRGMTLRVLDEAFFRVFSLPDLSPSYQKRYVKENGIKE